MLVAISKRLRIKESDRCEAMAQELLKCGVICAVGEDTMDVPGGMLQKSDTPYTKAIKKASEGRSHKC